MPDMKKRMRIRDAEGDPQVMDIVRVPEGFSFQIGDTREAVQEAQEAHGGYLSVIVDIDKAREIIEFIRSHVGI